MASIVIREIKASYKTVVFVSFMHFVFFIGCPIITGRLGEVQSFQKAQLLVSIIYIIYYESYQF